MGEQMTELKRYTMQWVDTFYKLGDDESPHNREDEDGRWCQAEEALALLAAKDARIAELEAQLVEGAEIILALTGREPVTADNGEVVGFITRKEEHD